MQRSDLEAEEDEVVATAEDAEVPGFRVEVSHNKSEATHGLTLQTTHVYITWTEMGAPPIQTLSVTSMMRSKKTRPLAIGLSGRKERKIPRKEKNPSKILTWKKQNKVQSQTTRRGSPPKKDAYACFVNKQGQKSENESCVCFLGTQTTKAKKQFSVNLMH